MKKTLEDLIEKAVQEYKAAFDQSYPSRKEKKQAINSLARKVNNLKKNLEKVSKVLDN